MTNLTPDQNQELSEKIEQAVKASARHLKMSPETKRIIQSMEKELNEAKVERRVMATDVGYIKQKLDDFIDCADRKYATKEELKGLEDKQAGLKELLTWKLGVVVAIGVAVIYFLVDILKDKIL